MRSGKTGTGKSNDAIWTAYEMWQQGMDIWSNTPLFFTRYNNGYGGENSVNNPEYFNYWERAVCQLSQWWWHINPKHQIRVYRHGRINYFETLDEIFHVKNAVIIFDEGQTAFRNYDWELVPRMFLHKLEQNRKHGLHLITTAQRVKAVNINYRELIQDWAHFETIFDIFGFHIYRRKEKDVDFITENLQEAAIPTLKEKIRVITPWHRKIYDTMYDVGFEPLQEYQLDFAGKRIGLIIETGTTVKDALKNIKAYQTAYQILEPKKKQYGQKAPRYRSSYQGN